MPQSWPKNIFIEGNLVTVNSYIVFPILLMFLTLYSDLSSSESYLKDLKLGEFSWGPVWECAKWPKTNLLSHIPPPVSQKHPRRDGLFDDWGGVGGRKDLVRAHNFFLWRSQSDCFFSYVSKPNYSAPAVSSRRDSEPPFPPYPSWMLYTNWIDSDTVHKIDIKNPLTCLHPLWH